MKYVIRKAVIEDLKSVQDLNYELFKKELNDGYDDSLNINWPYEETGEKYFTNQINNHFVYVTTDNNKIVGYLSGYIKQPNSAFTKTKVELDNMIVDEYYRNQGIGKALVAAFKDWCFENGAEVILVTASAKNEKGINFYKKVGFKDHEVTLELKLSD